MEKMLLRYKGNPADAEINLEKAVDSIRLDREQNILSDKFLKSRKDIADSCVALIFDHMIEEIAKVVVPDEK